MNKASAIISILLTATIVSFFVWNYRNPKISISQTTTVNLVMINDEYKYRTTIKTEGYLIQFFSELIWEDEYNTYDNNPVFVKNKQVEQEILVRNLCIDYLKFKQALNK